MALAYFLTHSDMYSVKKEDENFNTLLNLVDLNFNLVLNTRLKHLNQPFIFFPSVPAPLALYKSHKGDGS